jgi:hypothetical protein
MHHLAELPDNSPIGKNESISEAQLAMANVKLRQSSLPPIPDGFAGLLRKFNGLSNEGALVFGAEINSTLFVDLVEFNRKFFRGNPSRILILGYDECFYFLFDSVGSRFCIVDQDTFEPEFSSKDITEPVTFLLRLPEKN